jgi:hypothetical protein
MNSPPSHIYLDVLNPNGSFETIAWLQSGRPLLLILAGPMSTPFGTSTKAQ